MPLEMSKFLGVEPKDYFCVGFIIDYVALRCGDEERSGCKSSFRR